MPTFLDVLAEEKQTVSAIAGSAVLQARSATAEAVSDDSYGLAFSGGGIRSATFNLGILQGLAQAKLLPQMKYISTVSGGGYIGAWLVSWIKRAPKGLTEVQQKLGDYENHRDHDGGVAEPRQVNFLRDYSNYMTPRKGLVGADTWTGIATYQRNVLLNQCILVPVLGALVLLPWLLGTTAIWLQPLGDLSYGVSMVVVVAFFFLLLALLSASRYSARSSITTPVSHSKGHSASTDNEQGASQTRVIALVAVPLFLSAIFAGLAFWLWPAAQKQPFWRWALVGSLVYGICHLVGAPLRIGVFHSAGQRIKATPAQIIGIPLTALFAGAVGGLFLRICHQEISQWNSWGSSAGGAWHVIAWGPPILVVSFLLVGTLHIGLLKLIIGPEEQEWWGRLGGLLLLGVLAWVAIFGLAIFAPWIAERESVWVRTKVGLLIGWVGTTIFGLLSGKSEHTSGGAGAQVANNPAKSSTAMEVVAAVAPYVFILGMLILLSLGVHALVIWRAGEAATLEGYWNNVCWIPPEWPLVTMLVLAGIAAALAWRVDVNIFSMNLLYRNRLIRCYLGASRNIGERQPNRFTGFDSTDDLLLTEFDGTKTHTEHPELPAYKGPYPLICAALNVTHGERLAWQERKAESFVFTPKFCGYEYPEMKYEPDPPPKGTYRTTDEYAYPKNSHSALHLKAGGVHLGTAVSISGAAASPNMGYHTSPPLAFLMTVFDVRLGWWLPNPRYENKELSGDRTEGGPQWSLLYLLKELLASTTDQSKYVYLSDGGHFENLAIYELVRRRCKYIIASDADADDGMTFGDLGNAIRKCRSDFGVEITIDPTPVQLPLSGFAQAHGVIGKIRYPSTASEVGFEGEILYIKPTITPGTPRDVLAYRAGHREFPDQSTADQWFDESQFESYRRLGFHSMQTLTGMLVGAPQDAPVSVEDLFTRVRRANGPRDNARP
ncbi:MAG TPA: hypothetical protein VIH74_07390 [Candidatus Acidoferrum sp.]|jgi:hypothetical protein